VIDLQANLYPSPLTYEGRRLEGKVIVVFGASSGIGEAAVLRFAREGAAVMAAARRSERLISLVDQVEESGGTAASSTCDVRNEGEISRTVAQVVERFGRIDGAFNNAGVSGMAQPVDQITPEVFDDVMAVNLRGVALCMKHEIRAMQKQDAGGAIVNTSSIGALNANPVLPDYGASKAAVSHLTRSAAVGFGPVGIRVNAIAPGPTSSEMLDPWIADLESRKEWASSPLPFIALADDIARVALFLLSDEARWITGHVLPVDGGAAAT
jgi:NAD(P)-dependent dehydrogenase (short-subunit alcohol dehydrogenase family)